MANWLDEFMVCAGCGEPLKSFEIGKISYCYNCRAGYDLARERPPRKRKDKQSEVENG